MRCIGQLPDETQARRFSDYLYVQGMENTLETLASGGWNIWVHDDTHLCRAKTLLVEFARQPDHDQYREAGLQAAQRRTQSQRELRAYQKRLFNRNRIFRGSIGQLTSVLIALSVIMTALCGFGTNADMLAYFIISENPMAGVGLEWYRGLSQIAHGQIWRLFTPMFIHFDIPHILFNMLWLRDLGTMIEKQQGCRHLGMLVLLAGGISNLAQYAHSGPMFGGMSGVVYGLFGYVWSRGKADPFSGLYLHQETVAMMIVWLILGFIGLLGNVANTAHGTGLLVGILWGGTSGWLMKLRLRAWEKITVALLIIGVGGFLAGAIQHHRLPNWQLIDGNFTLWHFDYAQYRMVIVPTRHPQGALHNNPRLSEFTDDGLFLQVKQPVISILTWAYDVPNRQRVILNTELPEGEYDVLANLPKDGRHATQLALRDKFGLVGRWQKRIVEVLHLKRTRSAAPGLRLSNAREAMSLGDGYIAGLGQPISSLVRELEEVLDRPILEETGLRHRYDFVLEWSGRGLKHPDLKGFNQVMLDQLGLELVPNWEPLQMLVVNAEHK